MFFRLILRVAVNALGLWLASYLFSGVTIATTTALVVASIVLFIANAVIKPIIKLVTLPVQVFTLGLFSVVINIAMLYMVAWLVPGFSIATIVAAIETTLLLAVLNVAISIFKGKK